jgi:hypothetical protein
MWVGIECGRGGRRHITLSVGEWIEEFKGEKRWVKKANLWTPNSAKMIRNCDACLYYEWFVKKLTENFNSNFCFIAIVKSVIHVVTIPALHRDADVSPSLSPIRAPAFPPLLLSDSPFSLHKIC